MLGLCFACVSLACSLVSLSYAYRTRRILKGRERLDLAAAEARARLKSIGGT